MTNMNWKQVEQLTDAVCFALANDSPVRIAKMVALREDTATFRLVEVHPTRSFTVKSAREWLRSGESNSAAIGKVRKSAFGFESRARPLSANAPDQRPAADATQKVDQKPPIITGGDSQLESGSDAYSG